MKVHSLYCGQSMMSYCKEACLHVDSTICLLASAALSPGNRASLISHFCWNIAVQTPRQKGEVKAALCSMIKKCLGNGLKEMPFYIDGFSDKKLSKCD